MWTHSFESISPLWPPLPDKAIKLLFSTSPKTLSPRFNLVSGNRGHTWLQDLHVHDSNMFIFLPFMCFTSILLSVQPQALERRRGGNFPLPHNRYYFPMFSNEETKYSERRRNFPKVTHTLSERVRTHSFYFLFNKMFLPETDRSDKWGIIANLASKCFLLGSIPRC